MTTETFLKLQESLDRQDYAIGDVVRWPEVNGDTYRPCVVGNGGPEVYMLAEVGIDRFGRLWKQDREGFTLIADFSGGKGK